MTEKTTDEIVARAQALYDDLTFASAREWKQAEEGRKVIGHLPIYVPRELIHAAGMLPLGIMGGGDQLEVIHGDAYYQSYICRIPRSTIELGLSGRLDVLDGMIFPSICDVIRNLSGMWKLLFEDRFVAYFDVPQNYRDEVGGAFYRRELLHLKEGLETLAGRKVSDDDLRASLKAYDENRRVLRELDEVRVREPWVVPGSELYLLERAGMVLPVEEHTELLRAYLEAARAAERRPVDNTRVVLVGAFCEQPPLALIRTLERAGCDILDADWMLVSRWIDGDLATEGDPLDALVEGFLHRSASTSSKYEPDGEVKGRYLVDLVRRKKAEGVIFLAPSFCDPALLDRPMLQRRLDEAGIAYTSFKYAENSGQMQPIREQAGTFADSIKLWGQA
jgi:benzoyl-CoA reductase subunit C